MPKKKRETVKEKRERLQRDRFYEVLSLCGDTKRAARLVGMGMQKAYRALADPDGITKFERHNVQNNAGTFYTMDYEHRIALLTKCVLFGAMPRVIFDPSNGEPEAEIVYETMSQAMRLKCLDMINKMEGAYIERKEIVDKTAEIKVITGVPRAPNEVKIEEDPLEL